MARAPGQSIQNKTKLFASFPNYHNQTRQRKERIPPGTCPPLFSVLFHWASTPARSQSAWPSTHSLASPPCWLFRWFLGFPLLLPTAPRAHQPVFCSQEFLVNLAISHAIVMQLVRHALRLGLSPPSSEPPKKSITMPNSRGSGYLCTLSFLLPPLGSSFYQHRR